METLLETIRAAIAKDADESTRTAGAAACRAILTALEPAQQPPASPLIDPQQIASLVGTLRGLPADQLLDLAIAKLRAALPASDDTTAVQPIKFRILQLPRQGR